MTITVAINIGSNKTGVSLSAIRSCAESVQKILITRRFKNKRKITTGQLTRISYRMNSLYVELAFH